MHTERWTLDWIGEHVGPWGLIIAFPFAVWLALRPFIAQMRNTRDRKRRMFEE